MIHLRLKVAILLKLFLKQSNGGNSGEIYVESDNILHSYDAFFGANFGFKNIIVGPCTIHLTGSPRYNDLLGGCHTWRIKRASETGSKTLSWNGSEWEGSGDSQIADNNSNNSSPVPDPSGIKYDQLLGGATLQIPLGFTPTLMDHGIICIQCRTEFMFGMLIYRMTGWMKLHG